MKSQPEEHFQCGRRASVSTIQMHLCSDTGIFPRIMIHPGFCFNGIGVGIQDVVLDV